MADQDRKQQDPNKHDRDSNQPGERDDVAEDRNLSGASTWLNLPDQQPRGDSDSDSDTADTTDRQSNR